MMMEDRGAQRMSSAAAGTTTAWSPAWPPQTLPTSRRAGNPRHAPHADPLCYNNNSSDSNGDTHKDNEFCCDNRERNYIKHSNNNKIDNVNNTYFNLNCTFYGVHFSGDKVIPQKRNESDYCYICYSYNLSHTDADQSDQQSSFCHPCELASSSTSTTATSSASRSRTASCVSLSQRETHSFPSTRVAGSTSNPSTQGSSKSSQSNQNVDPLRTPLAEDVTRRQDVDKTSAPATSMTSPYTSYKTTTGRCVRSRRSTYAMTSSVTSLWRTLLLAVCASLLALPCQGTLDISAFEYQRKFHSELDLGDCPRREVKVSRDNDTEVIDERLCNIKYRAPVTHKDRRMRDTRNKRISSAQDVVNNLGLCGGEAASFLGILYNGDCISIEIASRLTFNEKTLVRAFIGHYRKSLDVLEDRTEQQDDQLVGGRERYYSDKIYLKNRSYGTLEVIFVQFRFKSATLAQAAAHVDLGSRDKRMSSYMAEIGRQAGEPKTTTVITLSTASKKGYDIKKFPEFRRARRHVQIRESEMEELNRDIEARRVQPHLQYTFDYFLKSEVTAAFRTQDKKPWEESSLLEVTLRGLTHNVKKYARRCRSRKMKQNKECKRVRELRRKMQVTQAAIHKFRSSWHDKTDAERSAFLARYDNQVKSYSRTSVIKDVQKLIRVLKKESYDKKIKQDNEIPTESTIVVAERSRDGKPGVRPNYLRLRTNKRRKNRKDRKDRKERRRKGRGRKRGGKRRGRKTSPLTSSTTRLDVTTPHVTLPLVTSRRFSRVTSYQSPPTTHVDHQRQRSPNIGTSNVRVVAPKRYMSSRSKVNAVSKDNAMSEVINPVTRPRLSAGAPSHLSRVGPRVSAVKSRLQPHDVRLTREPPAIRGFRRRPAVSSVRKPAVRLPHRGRILLPAVSRSPIVVSGATHILSRSPGTLSRSAITFRRSQQSDKMSRIPNGHTETPASVRPTIPARRGLPRITESHHNQSTVKKENQLSRVNESQTLKTDESELSVTSRSRPLKLSVARRPRLSAQRIARMRHQLRHTRRRRPVPPTNNG